LHRQACLLRAHSAELIVRVGFFGVYLDRAVKLDFAFFALASLLVDQSEIVVCRGISGIQVAASRLRLKIFARTLRADDVAEKFLNRMITRISKNGDVSMKSSLGKSGSATSDNDPSATTPAAPP